MNNLLSYNGLIDSRMRASDKDLPVTGLKIYFLLNTYYLSIDLLTSHWKLSHTLHLDRYGVCIFDWPCNFPLIILQSIGKLFLKMNILLLVKLIS